MDALKRAELAKQQGQTDSASGLSLEPNAGASGEGAPETLPSLNNLEALDEEFISHSAAPPPRGHASRDARTQARAAKAGSAEMGESRESIRNTFAAKNILPKDRQFPLIAALFGLLALGGVGTWLWLQLKPAPGSVAPRPEERQAFAANRGDIASPAPATVAEPRMPAVTGMPPAKPARTAGDDSSDAPEPRSTSRSLPRPNPAAALPNDASIRVTTSHAGIAPAVAEGYRLLQKGDLAAAKAAYEQALRSDQRNTDALHGLAAIALHQGRADEADAIFRQVLEVNPADAPAQAGLVGLSNQGDPIAAESRLKSLLAAQGEQPAAHFALGNLFARQQRWNEAQLAYFKAVAGDANNPDYLFNLAVSLDQIRQPKLAAQYYGQALTAADGRPVAFDVSVAARRLRELQN
jgi:Tfp pilus assembly protein PilF